MNYPAENLVGPAGACQILGIDLHGLLQGINDGIVPAYRIGEAVRFRPSELRHPALSGLAELYRSRQGHFAA
ncbi:helix-turn-helix domain-containing protein [Candidatus Poriferisocius sp.]|uniref:helix-turn-helix domain-containing protein n=1 Tax=Candidatus Poriferisocius sp. TaxID=3101276 RepID=UPI003B023EAC